jgi:hypothetical protein
MITGHCRKCVPTEWPQSWLDSRGSQSDHLCAAYDEDGSYGTVVTTRPRNDGNLHDRYVVKEWPRCETCGIGYCTWCGAQEWYQRL